MKGRKEMVVDLSRNVRFTRTDVTAVKLYEEYVIAGIGSSLFIYKKDTVEVVTIHHKILDGQKIYGIESSKDCSKLLIFGGKQFIIIERSNREFQLFNFSPGSIVCDDWLHSGTWLSDNEVGLLTAHNVVQIWDISKEPVLISQIIGKDNSILYSGLLLPLTDDVLVLSGTVFSQIIISRCKKEQPLHYLLGHKGVIFSISCCLKKRIIVTTSDDRSVRIWSVSSSIDNCTISEYWDCASISYAQELYGHSARVMRSCISNKYIISVGEDSCICFWDNNGTLVKRFSIHQNAPIWSVSVDDEHLVTGGGDCSVILHPLSTVNSFSDSEILKINDGNPKKIVFTARRNLVILKECGNLIYYDIIDKNETEYLLKNESTWILLTISLCKQIIAVVDMRGNLNVFIENCKGPAKITNVISTKLSIDKILSMDWAGNRHLVLCSGSGEIYVIASRSNEVEIISKHCLPNCKERWLTSAAMSTDNLLVVGDRCGNIHFYEKEGFNPLKTFNKVHGRYGPTSIRITSNEIITTGRDSTLKYFSLVSNNGVYNIKLTSSKDVGFPWVEKCIEGHDDLVCGFQERIFVISNIRNNAKLIEVSCGGGHRSWDVVRYIEKINDEYEEIIKLIYLKNSDINVMTFQLSKIVSKDIIKGTHSKEINCLKSHVPKIDESVVLFISGGEDTTLRISTSSKEVNFQDEVILKHLSSVRTLKTFLINYNKLLVVSGGGRAQICIKVINFSKNNDKIKIIVEELVDFLVKGTDKERKGDKTWRNCAIDFDPETRIMDLEIVEIDKNIFNIYTGCSDAFIRIYQFKYDEEVSFKHLGQVKYHKTCILKTHCLNYLNQIILITCSTRGEICFWDVTEPKATNEIKTFLVITSNKSGINCVATRIISEDKVIIATGGDDNAIHIKILSIQNKDFKTAKVTQSWSSDKFHCSQVTGILIIDDIFISTSIDQRITVFKAKEGENDLEFVKQIMTDVSDVQGLDLIECTENTITICVFGKGLEVLTIQLKDRKLVQNTSNTSMAPQVTAVTEPVTLGEGPHWDHREQALYFVSIFDRSIHKYVPATKKHTRSVLDDLVGFIVPIEGKPNHFVVGLKRRIAEVVWDGQDGTAKVIRTIAEIDKHNPENRLNDGKADPRGRLFAGTMGYEYEPGKFYHKKGALYRFDPDGKVHTLAENIDISNGLCWDVEEKAFYYADSFEYTIRRYDYDIETGDISNPKFVFNYKDHGLEGIVDGMTIDTEGNLWVANFDGHQVLKIDPKKGKLLQKIRIPALQVTSATFGGPNLDILYVTSACMNRGVEQKPPCGSTFQLTGLGVKGHPNANARFD